MLSWFKHRSGLSTRRKKYQHSRSGSAASDSSTCTTSSIDSQSTVRTTTTAGTEVSDHEYKYTWDLKTRSRSRSPSFSSFKTSDSLSSFECIGEEAIATATTATITRCKAHTSIKIIDKPALRKVKSDLWFDIRPIPTPGPTPEDRPRPIYQDRLNSWEQARPRDGLCPIGPFAMHPAHTCHYLHLPVAPMAV